MARLTLIDEEVARRVVKDLAVVLRYTINTCDDMYRNFIERSIEYLKTLKSVSRDIEEALSEVMALYKMYRELRCIC